jgi:hypothetical protein
MASIEPKNSGSVFVEKYRGHYIYSWWYENELGNSVQFFDSGFKPTYSIESARDEIDYNIQYESDRQAAIKAEQVRQF